MSVLYKRTLRPSDFLPRIHNMATRRSARINTILSNGATDVVHEVQPEDLSPEFVVDSLITGVGTVNTIQKRRLSATLETAHPSTKSKRSKKPRKRSEHDIEDDLLAAPKVPETPKKLRKQVSASVLVAPPLSTPTPSQVNLITDNNPNPATPKKATPSRRQRKVEPHATNAPLQTPGGSRITAYPSQVFEADSQTTSQQTDTLTTDNVLEKACAHLISIDPRLKTVIDQHHCRMFSPQGLAEEVDPFIALSSGIIGQQVRRKQNLTVQADSMLINSP